MYKRQAKTLHYSGYNLIKFGNKKYGYYYALNDNQCVFVILPVGSTPKKTLTNYSFKGKVIKPNSSYKEMLDAFSKDLNWDSPVSYTHLDVYKRQLIYTIRSTPKSIIFCNAFGFMPSRGGSSTIKSGLS